MIFAHLRATTPVDLRLVREHRQLLTSERHHLFTQCVDPGCDPVGGGTRDGTLLIAAAAAAADPVAGYLPPQGVRDGLGGSTGDGETPAMKLGDEFGHGQRPSDLKNAGERVAKISTAQQKERLRFVHAGHHRTRLRHLRIVARRWAGALVVPPRPGRGIHAAAVGSETMVTG